ncbi:MAG TPA: hypothetical protein VF777_04565 [Phycisphaerales bacterium]
MSGHDDTIDPERISRDAEGGGWFHAWEAADALDLLDPLVRWTAVSMAFGSDLSTEIQFPYAPSLLTQPGPCRLRGFWGCIVVETRELLKRKGLDDFEHATFWQFDDLPRNLPELHWLQLPRRQIAAGYGGHLFIEVHRRYVVATADRDLESCLERFRAAPKRVVR